MDGKVIILPSRLVHNVLRQLIALDPTKESKTYLLKTDGDQPNVGYYDNGDIWLSPAGSATLTLGSIIEEPETAELLVIKAITHIPDKGYVITFE